MNGLFLGEIGLPGVAQSVGVARRCVEEILSTAGHRDVGDALLVVSELMCNAIVHTASGLYGGLVTVEVIALSAELSSIEVTDDGADTVPRPRPATDDDCHGRGLWLVDQVSAKWGVRLLGGGQRAVWAETLTTQNAPARAADSGMAKADRGEAL